MAISNPVSMGTGVVAAGATAQTVNITTSVGAAIGDAVFVACVTAGNASFSVNDGHSNTYATTIARMSGSILTTAITAGDVVTVTTTQTANSMPCAIFKVTGLATPITADRTSASTSGTATTMGVGAISATQNAVELIVGIFAVSNILAVTFTPASGYTEILGGTTTGASQSLRLEYKVTSTTETPAPAATLSGSKAYDGRAVTINGAVAAGSGSGNMLLMGVG